MGEAEKKPNTINIKADSGSHLNSSHQQPSTQTMDATTTAPLTWLWGSDSFLTSDLSHTEDVLNTTTTETPPPPPSPSPPPPPPLWMIATQWLWQAVAPTIILIATVGNTLTLCVLRRLRFSASSIDIYLITVAVLSTVGVYLGLGRRWGMQVFRYDVYSVNDWTCKLGTWVFQSSAVTSCWVLVAMTIHRAGSVAFPHKVKSVCTGGRIEVVIAGLLVLAALYHGHILYGLGIVGGKYCGFPSESYRAFLRDTWATVDLIAYSFLPFFLLVVSNVILVRHLLASVAATKTQLTSDMSDHHVTARRRQASSTTVTVIAMSVSLLLLSGPLVIFNVIHDPRWNSSVTQDPAQKTTRLVLFMIASLGFGNNFFLYCLTGTRFRQGLKRLVCRQHPRADKIIEITDTDF